MNNKGIKLIKIYLLLILGLFTAGYSTKVTDFVEKNELENSKRIFIVKPKEEIKPTEVKEKKANEVSIPAKDQKPNEIPKIEEVKKTEKLEEEIQENIKLINFDSSVIIPKLKEISTAKATGINKEIIIKGSKKEIEEAKYIISNLDKSKRQIKIKATIVDTSDNLFERLGINFNAGNNQNSGSPEFFGSFLNGDLSLTGMISKGSNFLGINVDILKENGDIKIEAMPVLIILEGEEGELRVTEEVIVGEKKYQNKDEEYVEPVFAEAGVVFKIRPEIRDTGKNQEILLHIDSEISNFKLSSNFNADQGAKQKNKINTVIAIKDGGSVFIGGLKQNVLKESEKRVPVLSKIPILGALFKYKRKNKEIRDIYIEITGEIQYE